MLVNYYLFYSISTTIRNSIINYHSYRISQYILQFFVRYVNYDTKIILFILYLFIINVTCNNVDNVIFILAEFNF